MPMHDWTGVPCGLFHMFHQTWSVTIQNALNAGVLKGGYYALVEQRAGGPEPDVIAVQTRQPDESGGATATLPAPSTRRVVRTPSDAAVYARRANRVVIRHPLGPVVAVIEIVSPGNKDSRNALRAFVEKAVAFVRGGVHLLVVDPFPPSPARDPKGIHKVIWDEFADEPFELPEGTPLTFASYQADVSDYVAHLEFLAVGGPLPDMPLFLSCDDYVMAPLAATYEATWAVCPEPLRELLR